MSKFFSFSCPFEWCVQFCQKVVSGAITRIKTNPTVWKPMKNWSRKWLFFHATHSVCSQLSLLKDVPAYLCQICGKLRPDQVVLVVTKTCQPGQNVFWEDVGVRGGDEFDCLSALDQGSQSGHPNCWVRLLSLGYLWNQVTRMIGVLKSWWRCTTLFFSNKGQQW